MYEQYQDAADALRHERWGRRHAEAVLERVSFDLFLKICVLYLECFVGSFDKKSKQICYFSSAFKVLLCLVPA